MDSDWKPTGLDRTDDRYAPAYAFVVSTGKPCVHYLSRVASPRGFLGFERAGRLGTHEVRRRANRVDFSRTVLDQGFERKSSYLC
jgi:hypothetical protein